VTTIELANTRQVISRGTLVPAQPARLGQTVLAQPARVGFVATAAAIPPIAVLHMEADAAVDPVSWTISDYVVTLPHGMALFGMTAAALAVGAAALAHGLSPLPGTRIVRGLLMVWAVAAVVAAVFPTNLRGTPEDFSSTVHLMAGAVLFAVLPIAGAMVTRRYRRATGWGACTITLAVTSAVSGLLSTALILNRLPGVIGRPELMLPPGILQRASGGMEIIELAVIALTLLRSTPRVSQHR